MMKRRLFWFALLMACFIAVPFIPVRAAPSATIDPLHPETLQSAINAALRAGKKSITIPPGTYRLTDTLRLAHLKDFTVDAGGVTILRANVEARGIEFDQCENVSLHGLRLRCETLPFTQGKIVTLDPDRQWIDLSVDEGYSETYLQRPTTGYVFDRATRQWKTGTYDYGLASAKSQGDRVWRLTLNAKFGAEVSAGDLMAFRGPGAQDVLIARSKQVTLDGVVIRGGSGFCVHEDGGEGGHRYTYVVTYPPTPAGARDAPLIASNADAFHSGGVRHGPTLLGCQFEGMCDDGIPIHGYYRFVVSTDNDGRILVLGGRGAAETFRSGDPVRAYDKSGALVGEATVQTVTPVSRSFQPASLPDDKRYEDDGHYVRLELDRKIAANSALRVSNPNANGSNFVIRGCVIKNHRARGMLIKADNGLIEGNVVDGSTIAGLVIAPEFFWNEADYSRNIIVRHNAFRHCGNATAGPWTDQAGAVTVLGIGDQSNGIAFGHQHITFEDNVFEESNGVNLLISGAQQVVVDRNHFVWPQRVASIRGRDRGIDPAAVIFLDHCREVRLLNNELVSATTSPPEFVKLGPAVTDFHDAGKTQRVEAR